MKIILTTIISLIALTGCYNDDNFKNGDVIFHTSKSPQSKMIQDVTQSKYSHVGIIYIKDGETYVMEAVQPVKVTPLNVFIERGVGSKYTVMRYKGNLWEEDFKKMYDYGSSHLGKNYDSKFQWSDNTIYCSELVYKIYETVGVELCDKNTFSDYNLSSKEVQTAIKNRYNTELDMEETIVTPVDLSNSNLLTTVFDNY
jgi:hypothetical protein